MWFVIIFFKLLLIVSAFNWECPRSSLTNLFWSITCALALVFFELCRKRKWMNSFTTVVSVSAFVSLHFSTSALLCCSPLLFSFCEIRCFFAIKAQRNQSVTVSSETGKESKSVWKQCSQDDDKRVSDASAVWQPCCRKHFARISPVAEVNQPKWSQHATKTQPGVVWFHSAQTAEWFVLWPFCLCWRTQPF